MTAYCNAGGFTYAGVKFDTAEAVDVFTVGAQSINELGNAGMSFTIAADSTTNSTMVQLVSATGIATVTISYGDDIGLVDTCDFYVQVVESNG